MLPLDRWLERNGAARGAVTTPNDGQSTQPNQELPTITVDGRTRGTR
jgi:hypothetical protein